MIESKAPAAMHRQHPLTPYIDCNTYYTFLLGDIRFFASRPAGQAKNYSNNETSESCEVFLSLHQLHEIHELITCFVLQIMHVVLFENLQNGRSQI